MKSWKLLKRLTFSESLNDTRWMEEWYDEDEKGKESKSNHFFIVS